MTHASQGDRLRILQEQRIDIGEACVMLGTAARPAHPSTVRRAMQRGDLEFLKIGGKVETSIEAVERFVAVKNGIDPGTARSDKDVHTPSKRRERELSTVDAQLKAAGL